MSDTAITLHKFDAFLSFRGIDTRRNFISFLYKELTRRNIRTFKDDNELERGRRISPELIRAIEESKFAVVVVSENYAASPWCLQELVKIMDFENKGSITVMPIFYGVDPCHVRRQIGLVDEQFKKHEAREDHEKVLSWRQALTNLASISGDCSWKWEDDSKMVDAIADKISKKLMIDTTRSNGSDLEGIDAHMKALHRLLDLNSKKTVRVIGIWARGGKGRSALAKFVYQNICQHFESHCFLESVKRISQDCHMSQCHEEFILRNQGERLRNLRLKNQKVLLVADDVNKLEQLDALAEDFNCFSPGSVVIITTQDRQIRARYVVLYSL
ncbi:toll/interleukin-1 receptor-like protein isoform X2 [Capsella rubella]|uniref:toll/interleukin-1 receptor-like protein isoform X2 n=1 Tax=Capsella rubella TaxID=81985 RepID=UPI000CD59A2E|nr:toll/interleukin-1 receptor-like protein isoform X2 [Capsella rubella]